MKNIKSLLCVGLSVLFMVSVFQPGYRIVLDGHAIPGIYEHELTLRCNSAAIRAAEEITRTHEDVPYTLVPVLCLKHTEADEQQLWGIMLDSYEGVVKMYEVSMNGVEIGTVSNLHKLYLTKGDYFPVWSPNAQLTIRETYTFPEAETPAEEVEAVFRRLSSSIEPV